MKKWKKALLIILTGIAALYAGFLVIAYIPSPEFEPITYEPITPDYWPTNGFRTSTPEEQGMNSAKLVEMVQVYQEDHTKNPTNSIDSITIIRNGYVVADLYFNPLYPKDTRHVLHSQAKSILSALVGIAIEQGHIESVNIPVIEFFNEKDFEIIDERIKDVTLKDLLSMETGIRTRDSYLYQYEGLFETMATDDWVEHFFTFPVDVEPGTRFDYSNLSSFMISAIIQEATGMDTLSYARENLFEPLGIEDIYWENSPKGITVGFARLWMKPHDFAKFGLLYLQQGQWDGQQIVPAAWIQESLSPHAYPKNVVNFIDENGKKDVNASQTNWISNNFMKSFADGYGYQWWLDKEGNFNALGTSGQYLIVAPKENLVVMITNSSSDLGPFFPGKLFYDYILESVESDKALPVNASAQNLLADFAVPPKLNQESQTVPELPAIALDISGETYSLEPNRWNYNNFRFVFDPKLDYAKFSYTAKVHEAVSFQVGLDGVYRFSDTEIGGFAAVGRWTSPTTFEISFQQIGYSAPAKFVLIFDQDAIQVTEISLVGSTSYSGRVQ